MGQHALNTLFLQAIVLTLALLLPGCGAKNGTDSMADSKQTTDNRVAPAGITATASLPLYVKLSADFYPGPRQRILNQLQSVAEIEVLDADADLDLLPANATALVLGNTGDWQRLFDQPFPSSPEPESFSIRSAILANQRSVYFAQGNAGGAKNLVNSAVNIGDLYATYALLEQMGFAFLHPLQVSSPSQLQFPASIEQQEKPRWPIRGWHIHTQHPLELTHVLNGWGPDGVDDLAGWESLLPEWESFLEWAVANRQNRVEWFLLMAESWQTFADSPERQRRLGILVDMAHEWGLAAGIDAPIAFRQQHAWTMLRHKGDELAQIRQAIDWLDTAGFDYFEIEAGFSEFTHPNATQMLAWMNEASRYSADQFGKPTYIKVHCTQNQIADNFADPETGAPLNFNFLPYYADSRLGVMPHTVQYYDLEGPAYTYNNTRFDFMRRYMQLEAGRREVLFYPETAYWVSYDIDVPLFLPIYADRRLYDLRLIATDEDTGAMGRSPYDGARIDGQVNFSSGWEWGYWLNDVVTARAAWNPHMEITDHQAALRIALRPVVQPFGEAADAVSNLLLRWISAQNALLLHGEVNGTLPAEVSLRNAQAYLQGWETWDEIAKSLQQMETQPGKMGLLDMQNPLLPGTRKIDYSAELQPLLSATAVQFRDLFTEFSALESAIPAQATPLFAELKDAMEITVLRAEQVWQLYETVNSQHPFILNTDKTQANIHLNKARRALDRAQQIVRNREQHYRVDPERIASWQYNPTAYHFGYLWSVRTLHYWWRDEGKVVDRPPSPGYLNIIDPVDLANGEGDWKEGIFNLSAIRAWLTNQFGAGSWLDELLTEPAQEYQYPPNNLRSRPDWYYALPDLPPD